MTEIYDNLLTTDRMLKRLEADKFFAVENISPIPKPLFR